MISFDFTRTTIRIRKNLVVQILILHVVFHRSQDKLVIIVVKLLPYSEKTMDDFVLDCYFDVYSY
jgi:hypothetical protein